MFTAESMEEMLKRGKSRRVMIWLRLGYTFFKKARVGYGLARNTESTCVIYWGARPAYPQGVAGVNESRRCIMDDTTSNQNVAVEKPATEQRKAYGTAKTENLRDSG